MPIITKDKALSYGYKSPIIQTILIPMDKFKLKEAKKWLRDNNYRSDSYRKTTNFYRFIQNYPIKNAEYYTIKLDNGVELVFEKF